MTTKAIEKSDKRIAAAMATLNAHDRGRNVLTGFKALCYQHGAIGLDNSGQEALGVLVEEMSIGRRDFMGKIKKPEPEVVCWQYGGHGSNSMDDIDWDGIAAALNRMPGGKIHTVDYTKHTDQPCVVVGVGLTPEEAQDFFEQWATAQKGGDQ